MRALFWGSVLVLFYAYLGYPLAVRLAATRERRPRGRGGPVGRVYLLVSAYNEAAVIGAKVRNSLAATDEDTRVVVVSDGCTDATDAIVAEHASRSPRLALVRVEGRRGKNSALNEAVAQLSPDADDVLVFSDANAMYEPGAVRRLCEALRGGAACVVGKLEFVDPYTDTAAAEGLYWRYENGVKAAEGRMGRLLAGNGAIFAIRAGDFRPIPSDVCNDFWIPIRLLGGGREVVYEPGAVAREPAPTRGGEEFTRKVRMANRAMRAVMDVWRSADFVTRVQLVSHKVVRWLALLVYACAVGSALSLARGSLPYAAAAGLLLLPLLAAALGAAAAGLGARVPLTGFAVHFFLVHGAALIGVAEAVLGKRRATWRLAASARRGLSP